jgi:hypothetical protein
MKIYYNLNSLNGQLNNFYLSLYLLLKIVRYKTYIRKKKHKK